MSAEHLRQRLRQRAAVIMGIVNTTPDSFSDGGLFVERDKAVKHALELVDEGAELIDVGGESTRPGAQAVSLKDELQRTIPVIEMLAKETNIPISIDSSKPEVMQAAVKAGASMINDVNGLRAPKAVDVASELGVPVCIMHMQGEPRTMQHAPVYDDVVEDVKVFFRQRLGACLKAGVAAEDIIIDPGIGFGKTLEHNLQLLAAVGSIKHSLNCEVLIGVSRKSMIEKLLGRPVEQRLSASLGLAVQSVLNGAKIVRVHDVQETHDAVRAAEAVQERTQFTGS